MNPIIESKPHFISFMLYKMAVPFFIFLLLGGLLMVENFVWGIGLFVLGFGVCFGWNYIVYTKTNYILLDNKIVRQTGSLFSDHQTDLSIRNITHMKLVLPFISHKLFGTGNLKIESAGSSKTEGNFTGIPLPQEFYEKVQEQMKQNGFVLNQSNLSEELTPSSLAVFIEVFKRFIGVFVFLLIMSGLYMGEEVMPSEFRFFFGAVITSVLVILLISSFISYQNLKRRKYRIFDDSVTYSEGFLTKHYAVIPYENLTDSSSSQGFVDRLLGLFDIQLSCQGSSQEIKFKNIKKGNEASELIKSLIKDFAQIKKKTTKSSKSKPKHQEYLVNLDDYNKTHIDEYKMDFIRTLAVPFIAVLIGAGLAIGGTKLLMLVDPFVLEEDVQAMSFSLLVPGLIAVVYGLVQIFALRFSVEEESMKHRYSLISTKESNFVNTKITAVVFIESWVDKIFGTCKVVFWSIGSSQKMKFNNIKKTPDLYTQILSKVGIEETTPNHEIRSIFTFIDLLKSILFASIALLFLLVGMGWLLFYMEGGKPLVVSNFLLSIIIPFGVFYTYSYFYHKRSNIEFFDSFIKLSKGLLVQQQYYSGYQNIKDVETVKYPLTDTGKIKFNVAGESGTEEQSTNNQLVKFAVGGMAAAAASKNQVSSFSFSQSFIPQIPLQNNLMPLFLTQRIKESDIPKALEYSASDQTEVLLKSRPSLMNALFPILIFFVLIDVLCFATGEVYALASAIIIQLIIIGAQVWSILCVSFVIEPTRIIKRSGIFYKKYKSVLFSKVDHVSKKQGFLNKIFKNGTLDIHTIGSSRTEIKLNDIDEFKEAYDLILEEVEG